MTGMSPCLAEEKRGWCHIATVHGAGWAVEVLAQPPLLSRARPRSRTSLQLLFSTTTCHAPRS